MLNNSSFTFQREFIKITEIYGLPWWLRRQRIRVQSLALEDPLEWDMETHSSILAWRIPAD